MIENHMLDEQFFRAYLSEEIVDATDFTTLTYHNVQFIDPDYHLYIYGILWSAKVNGERAYFYIVVKIGDEVSTVFLKSIIDEVTNDKIIAWHKKEFPDETKNPIVERIAFQFARKKDHDAS